MRQGCWELTQKKVLISGYAGYGSEEGCRYFENVERNLIAKGNYTNDLKTGTWNYFSGTEGISSLDKQITYRDDGSFEEINPQGHYILNISWDSLEVTGEYYSHLDTIQIECNTGWCTYGLANGEEFLLFQFLDWDAFTFELHRLRAGEYNRKIWQKKYEH